MGIADRDETPWIAKLFCGLRHNSIESTVELLSNLVQSVWVIDGAFFNYIEYIDFRPPGLRKRAANTAALAAAGVKSVA